MRFFLTIFCALLFGLFFIHAIAQEPAAVETNELIELEGDEGRILVFPCPIPGPDGPIIKFVMFGVYDIPDVIIDTMEGSISPNVTTVHFTEGRRFSGFFDVPGEKIISIWINGWFIPWGDMQ